MVAFESSSVYGMRQAYQEILLVTSADSKNIFHRSPAWKQGLVPDVQMLARSDMVKPPRTEDAKFGTDGRFTRVQEMKQANLHKILTKVFKTITCLKNFLSICELPTFDPICSTAGGHPLLESLWTTCSRIQSFLAFSSISSGLMAGLGSFPCSNLPED